MPNESQMDSTVRVISVEKIRRGDDHRPVQVGRVRPLAESLRSDGLVQALAVARKGPDGLFELIDGGHRLEAAKTLGWTELPCVVVDVKSKKKSRAKIAASLFRAPLSALDEAEMIRTYVRKLPTQKSKRSKGRPQGGTANTARGMRFWGRTEEARRKRLEACLKIAAISKKAKGAIRKKGLQNKRVFLLEVASCPAAKQRAFVRKYVKAAQTKDKERRARAVAKPLMNREALERAWSKWTGRRLLTEASAETKRWFQEVVAAECKL